MRASESAYRKLRADIIHWRLEPGTPLGEVELSARLGVSRTPVREALSRLIAEGLVSNDAGRTAKVAQLSRDDIRKLFELREALETQAARLAARHRNAEAFAALKQQFQAAAPTADDDNVDVDIDIDIDIDKSYVLADRLDDAIDTAMANQYLQGALRDIRGHIARLRRHAHSNPVRLEQATAEHLVIVDAILRQDEMLAAQATAVHLRNSLDNILANHDPREEHQ